MALSSALIEVENDAQTPILGPFTVTAPGSQTLTYRVNAVTNVLDSVEVRGNGTYTLTSGSSTTTATGTFDVTTQGNGSLTTFFQTLTS